MPIAYTTVRNVAINVRELILKSTGSLNYMLKFVNLLHCPSLPIGSRNALKRFGRRYISWPTHFFFYKQLRSEVRAQVAYCDLGI